MLIGRGLTTSHLTEAEIRTLAAEALAEADLVGKRVLVIIPDSTRTAPIPLFFRLFHELVWGQVAALDYLVALGTHQPMGNEALNRLLGTTAEERSTRYAGVHVYNHCWDRPDALTTLGTIPEREMRELSGGRLSLALPVRINKMILEYDLLIICGPVFPHEVIGFSGGHKYLFPGISGPEVIDVSHWMGALMTTLATIGIQDTPSRRMIDRAAAFVPVPTLCFALVVEGLGVGGLFIGPPQEAWNAAADLSAQLHVVTVERPFRRVLSVMPELYDDLWTAAKGMYKVEPAIADGGEVIIYAPAITEVSYTHAEVLDQVGYHVRDYFVKQWDRFKHFPWGVLAHSTHLRGAGTYDADTGVERPRIEVKLATGIPRQRCERINLGYMDPGSIDPEAWADREDEGVLLVRKAGEMLYRLI